MEHHSSISADPLYSPVALHDLSSSGKADVETGSLVVSTGPEVFEVVGSLVLVCSPSPAILTSEQALKCSWIPQPMAWEPS